MYPGLYYFDTFTFTTMGTSGTRGPDSTKKYSNAPWREGDFSIVDGQQQWTVPVSGTYSITASGAYSAKKGRIVSGDVELNEGQVLTMLVGQLPYPVGYGLGGGGGTFIVANGKPLIVVSGGDGTGGHDASFSPYGSGNGINGAGYFTDGSNVSITYQFSKPTAYINGGFGNSYEGSPPYGGGFGGGQGFAFPPTSIYGGGGYTGSPGDGLSGATCYADDSVQTFTDLGATSNSSGYVIVSLVNPITIEHNDTIVNTEIYASPSGFAYWSDIAYSPGLKLFVAPSSFYNGQGIAYSPDGKQWFRSDYTGQGPWVVAWSPELGIFTTAKNGNYISSNGKNWIQVQGGSNWFSDIIWVPFLHKFIAISAANSSSEYFSESSDGQYWSPITTGPNVTNWYYQSYSVFAISQSNVLAGFYTSVYVSSDGATWNQTLTTTNNINNVAYGNGVFFVESVPTYYYSQDGGQTWSNEASLPFVNDSQPVSSVVFTDTQVVVTGLNETLISSDYIHWTRYPNNIMNPSSGGYRHIVYNPVDKYLVAVSDREINLAIDGTLWVPADTTYIGGVYDNVMCSPETSTVVLVASNGQITSETGTYTKDGVVWNRIPGLTFNPTTCQWNPLQRLFYIANNQYQVFFDPDSETLVSGNWREWVDSSTSPQLLQWYYDQTINNCLPISKAFSLNGIIVDTEPDINGYSPRISCSGSTFIKMARYPLGISYSSTDGTNWTQYSLQGDAMGECNRIIYILKYNTFYSLSNQEGKVFKSSDGGITWTCIYTSPGIYLNDMTYVPLLNKLFLITIANNIIELTFQA